MWWMLGVKQNPCTLATVSSNRSWTEARAVIKRNAEFCERQLKIAEHDVTQSTAQLKLVTDRLVNTPAMATFMKTSAFGSSVAFPAKGHTGPTHAQIMLYGSKIAHVLYQLQTVLAANPQHRIILFSQYNSTLTRIQSVMNSHGVEWTQIAKGNVHVRAKALRLFYSQDRTFRVWY